MLYQVIRMEILVVIVRFLGSGWSEAVQQEAVIKPVVQTEEEQVAESTTENIFSSDSSSEDDMLRGVSNVVYRKEYNYFKFNVNSSFVQSVYTFTSEQLGVGATGPIRVVVNR